MFIVNQLFWLVYPLPGSPANEEFEHILSIQMHLAKFLGYLVIVLISVYIIYAFKFTHGLKSIFFAIICVISYRVIAAIFLLDQVGYEQYFKYSPFKALFIAITLSVVVFLVSYKWLPSYKPIKGS